MSLLTPDTSDIKDFYKRGQYLLAWRISIGFTFMYILLGGIFATTNPEGLIPVSAVLSIAIFGFYYLQKIKTD